MDIGLTGAIFFGVCAILTLFLSEKGSSKGDSGGVLICLFGILMLLSALLGSVEIEWSFVSAQLLSIGKWSAIVLGGIIALACSIFVFDRVLSYFQDRLYEKQDSKSV